MSAITSENKIVILVFISYLVYYYNRKSVVLIFPQLIKEGLTQQNAGIIASSQSVASAVVTFSAGILSDRISAKFLVTFGLILCGFSTILFPFGTSVTQYSILWFINGVGQGFCLPSVLKLTKDSSHPTRFATNWSIVLISVNVSGVVNPLLSAYIIKTFSWKTSLFFSAFMALTAGIIAHLFIDEPNDTKIDEKSDKKAKDVNTSDILKFPMLWMCVISRFIVALTRIGIADWSQIFFINEQKFDLYISSSFVSIMEFGGIFGKLISGRISDLLMKRALKSNTNISSVMTRLPVSVGMLALNVLALHYFNFYLNINSSFISMSICALLIGITTAGNIVNFSVISTEIGTKKYSGLTSSMNNLAAKIGGIVTGLPLSLVANYYSWNFGYILIEILCILSFISLIIVPKLSTKLKFD